MAGESRSRSRSPLQASDDENNSRSRWPKKVIERPKGSGRNVPSECRVYVSNIPYDFKWQDLKDLFRSEVGNVAYVEMFMDENKRPRGSAIVDFDDSEMAQKAIEKMHRREIKGRKLIVKEKDEIIHSRDFMFLFNSNMDRDGRFGKDLDQRRGGGGSFNFTSDSQPPPINYGNTYGLSVSFLESLGITGPLVNRVFVANLDYNVTEDNLREVFNIAGKVVNVEILKDQDGKSRGFAIIEYEHPLQAVQSVSMLHNQSYYDRKINVRIDRVSEKRQKVGSSNKLPPGLKGLGMGFGANGQAIVDLTGFPSVQGSSGLAPSSNSVCPPPVNNNMGMGAGSGNFNTPPANNMASNLAAGVNAAMSMMSMAGMDSMSMGGGGGGGGSAVNSMNMGNPMGNTSGMGMLNQGNMNPVPNNSSFGNPGMGMATGNGGNMFNTPANNFNNAMNSNEFNSNFASCRSIVKISNLPMDFTWQNLKDLCRNYGDIRFVEMKSKGVGWVRFSSEAEAQRTAELLDRQRFDNRVISACIV